MNGYLLTAALLAAFTTIIHVFVGGDDVAAPLLASTMDGTLKSTLYVVWHMVSVVLGLSAAALLIGARSRHAVPARYLVRFVSVLWCGFGIIFLVVAASMPDSGGFLALPQWALLLPVGVLGLVGSRRRVAAQ